MDVEARVQHWIEKHGMPEKREGHLVEVMQDMREQKTDVVTFGCFMQETCLVCCVGEGDDEYCWIEWCYA